MFLSFISCKEQKTILSYFFTGVSAKIAKIKNKKKKTAQSYLGAVILAPITNCVYQPSYNLQLADHVVIY